MIKCEAVEFSFAFENQNKLLAALKAVNPFLARIPVVESGISIIQNYSLHMLGTADRVLNRLCENADEDGHSTEARADGGEVNGKGLNA